MPNITMTLARYTYTLLVIIITGIIILLHPFNNGNDYIIVV